MPRSPSGKALVPELRHRLGEFNVPFLHHLVLGRAEDEDLAPILLGSLPLDIAHGFEPVQHAGQRGLGVSSSSAWHTLSGFRDGYGHASYLPRLLAVMVLSYRGFGRE